MAVFGGWGDSLVQIRLSSERITDGGMAHMARCTRLENMFIPRGVTWRPGPGTAPQRPSLRRMSAAMA